MFALHYNSYYFLESLLRAKPRYCGVGTNKVIRSATKKLVTEVMRIWTSSSFQ